MKKNSFHFGLGFYFSLVVFGIMTGSVLALMPFIAIASSRGFFNGMDIVIAFVMMYLFSMIAGVTISAIVGNRILKPIRRFSDGCKKVAGGDFSVRLNELSAVRELADMAGDFNKMVQELGATETFRGDFIANISHEFKTPLAAIEGYAVLLRSSELSDEEKREYIDKIIAGTRRLSKLSGNILKISQLEGQEIIKDKKPFRLDEQLRQAILLCESGWSEKDIELDIDLDDTVYRGNDELLMQVWLNIISNAIKFTDKGGKISVSLKNQNGFATVRIRDTGIGMNDETLHRIFDKFYQGDTSHKSDGNGLGLALAARIVAMCQGSVKASSKPGVGSEFCVKLPFDDTQTQKFSK